MKKKNLFGMRFAVVILAAGFLSPSISVKSVHTPSGEGFDVSISMLNTAEARKRPNQGNRNKGNNRNVNRNKSHNRNVNRNVNVNHSGGRYYGGGSYHNNNEGAALVTGLVIGAAVASSNNNSNP